MNVRVLLFAGVGAVVLGTLAASANAAPVGAAGIIVSASDVSNIDTVQYRRCWNCRPYVPPYFYRGTPWSYDPYYYGPLYATDPATMDTTTAAMFARIGADTDAGTVAGRHRRFQSAGLPSIALPNAFSR